MKKSRTLGEIASSGDIDLQSKDKHFNPIIHNRVFEKEYYARLQRNKEKRKEAYEREKCQSLTQKL